MQDPVIVRTRSRRVSVPAYYLGRPASLWLSVTTGPRRGRSAPGDCRTPLRRKSC